jgi:Txe/YoeB family toxin of Txe-Axe toxin-antitoxin module
MKRVIFEATAFEDFVRWASENKKPYAQIVRLIEDIQRSPFNAAHSTVLADLSRSSTN